MYNKLDGVAIARKRMVDKTCPEKRGETGRGAPPITNYFYVNIKVLDFGNRFVKVNRQNSLILK